MATCADPGKGIATQRFLRPKLKTRTKSKTPNPKARLKDSNPKAKPETKNSNGFFRFPFVPQSVVQFTKIPPKWNRTTKPMAAECVPHGVIIQKEIPNLEALITKSCSALALNSFSNKCSTGEKRTDVHFPHEKTRNPSNQITLNLLLDPVWLPWSSNWSSIGVM